MLGDLPLIIYSPLKEKRFTILHFSYFFSYKLIKSFKTMIPKIN